MNARYEAQKELKIQQAIDTLVIESDDFGTYATVPSTTAISVSYVVTIDESVSVPVATDCNCVGHKEYARECVHMIAVNRLFSRVHARPIVTVGEAITSANEQVRAHIEAVAVAGDHSYSEAVGYAEVVNPRTGLTAQEYQNYLNYMMQIGVYAV